MLLAYSNTNPPDPGPVRFSLCWSASGEDWGQGKNVTGYVT